MIERKFVAEKMKEFLVHTYLFNEMGAGKFSSFEIKRTPLGEKVVIYTARPGIIVGKKGENIKRLTRVLKNKFKMENPQIEVAEITNPALDAQTMAEFIVSTMERFGPRRFKSTGYRTLQRIIDAGAVGTEILISGRGLPGSRAKTWRFYKGYLKKSGDIAMSKMDYGRCVANLKSGSVGVKVKILHSNVVLPDKIDFIKKEEVKVEVSDAKEEVEEKIEEKEAIKKKVTKKKAKKKVAKKKEEPKQEEVVEGKTEEASPVEEKVEEESKNESQS